MKTRIITTSLTTISFLLIFSTINIVYANEALIAKHKDSINEYTTAKNEYLKVKNLSPTDERRINSGKNVLEKVTLSISTYLDIYNTKQNWLLSNTNEFNDILIDQYNSLDTLNEKIDKAKNLQELKECLVEAKEIWNKSQSDCKTVQARWLMYSTKLSYNKIGEIFSELENTEFEINKTKYEDISTQFNTNKTTFSNFYMTNLVKTSYNEEEYKVFKEQIKTDIDKLKQTKIQLQELIK